MKPVGTLVINEYGKDAREFRIAGEVVRIGRDPRGDIVLADLAVSRHHARIVRQGEAFLIEDLASSNGTYLNDEKVPERSLRALSSGDRVQIGRSVLRFILKVTSRIAACATASPEIALPQPIEQRVEGGDRGDQVCLFRLQKIEASLLIVVREALPQRHVLASDLVRIGSDSRLDVVLTDSSISAHHADIVYNREGFHLVDRDSQMGTFLDGVAVRVARLLHRSYVRFGRQKALFVIYEAGTEPPEVSFRLRDRLMDVYPERRKEIQQAFKACREQGLDIADVLVERGHLDPEEWWLATREFKERPSGSRLPMLERLAGLLLRRRAKAENADPSEGVKRQAEAAPGQGSPGGTL